VVWKSHSMVRISPGRHSLSWRGGTDGKDTIVPLSTRIGRVAIGKGGFDARTGRARMTKPAGRRVILIAQHSSVPRFELYRLTVAAEIASLCLNVIHPILPVRLNQSKPP
jgi:hypothetical protein